MRLWRGDRRVISRVLADWGKKVILEIEDEEKNILDANNGQRIQQEAAKI